MEPFSDLDYKDVVKNIRIELKDYLKKSKLKSLVIGVSGGLDSAACILLAKPVCDELGVDLIGRSISIETNTLEEETRASRIGELCTSFLHLILTDTYNHLKYVADLEAQSAAANPSKRAMKIRDGNLKARLRMIVLYNLASMYEGMVLSTDNKTEYLLGFWTLHGDVGDYGMIQNLWKSEVYNMTEWIRDNEIKDPSHKTFITQILEADATDGLGISNTDLDQIMPEWTGGSRHGYLEVDNVLVSYAKDQLLFNGTHPVIKRHKSSQFKRENPFNINRDKIVKK